MLAFESLTPEALLKEVAEFLRQLAGQDDQVANSPILSKTKAKRAEYTARRNALTSAAIHLEGAAIIPACSILREQPAKAEEKPAPVHTSVPGRPNPKIPGYPFTVGRNDLTGEVRYYATLREAEGRIGQLEETDAEGVHAGNYYVDGPEELINPPRTPENAFTAACIGVSELSRALGVIVLDHRIREWLEQNDPKALEQATDALTAYEPAYAARLAEARANRREAEPQPETEEQALARMDGGIKSIGLGIPEHLIHRHGNTYFTKMGRLFTVDLIEDNHGRWIAAVFQGELGVENQEATAKRIVQLWNDAEANGI